MIDSCVVLIAHGSRNPKWLVPFEQLIGDLKQDVGEDNVFLCYMKHGRPQLPQLAQELAGRGVRHIRILPLFMATGLHLKDDIPEEINAIKQQFPELEIELLSPIGEHPLFLDMMHRLARQFLSESMPAR